MLKVLRLMVPALAIALLVVTGWGSSSRGQECAFRGTVSVPPAPMRTTARSRQDQAYTEWRVMPIRSEEEYALGRIGGEAEQHPHSIARSLSHPDVVYISHDVAGLWRSMDGGETWRKALGEGMFVHAGQSVEVDPIDPNVVFMTVDNSYNWLAPDYQGLYRSRDRGDHWELVLPTDPGYDSSYHRIYRHNIVFDPASVTGTGAARWYVAFPGTGELYRSDDGGDTWGGAPVDTAPISHIVYGVYAHPTDGQTVYVVTDQGLFASTARGENLQPLGDLPAGAVSSLAIDPQSPQTVYATLQRQGLYRSINGGQTFTLLKSFDASRVFINPGYPDVIYLVGYSPNTIISHDGGTTWIEDMVTVPAPGLGRSGSGWKGRIAGELSGIVPNPNDPDEAVAFSRATLWKTTDGGHTFVDSSTLFTGYAWSWWNGGAAFDRFDPDRFAFFNCDVGMAITENGADYFDQRNGQAWDWYTQGLIDWIGAYAGSFQPIAGSDVIVASVGGYFHTQLMRSTDDGETWQLVTSGSEDDDQHLFVAFHPNDPSLVYAGDKISTDAGQTFNHIDFGTYSSLDPSIVGMCASDPDTIYAMDVPLREYLLRSDDRGQHWAEYAHPGWRFRQLDSLPTFAVNPADCDTVYTLDNRGDLAIYNGTTFTSTGVLDLAGGSEAGNFVRTVVVDPNHPEVIYAGMFAYGIPPAWRSTDGGGTWEDISHNLPRTGLSAMAVNPHTGELFKGSAVGTWVFPPPYPSENLVYSRLVPPEIAEPLSLVGRGADRAIHLTWQYQGTLPSEGFWHIDYISQTGTIPLSVTHILSSTRAYTLPHLVNGAYYTVTLSARSNAITLASDTVCVMPIDKFVYLPFVLR